ncbi:FG-GAP repeat domain-containing protein, partial [Neorhizobium sp. DT-125]|uniref:FG-GAP repeat domain-containing protein n=1 Tax=Neorhizobium sp. DT-125 TaxID=3396163 RepID=UPI003F1E28E8
KTIRQMTYDNLAFTYVQKANQFEAPFISGGITSPLQQQGIDFDFDGKDELYGEKHYPSCQPSDCGDAAARAVPNWELIKFDTNGTVTSKSNVVFNEFFSADPGSFGAIGIVGRFLANKPKDISFVYGGTYTSSGSESDWTTTFQGSRVGVTTSNLALGLQNCSGSYASFCQDTVNPGLAALDQDGDGLDTVVNFGSNLVGIADFSGNGRQGAVVGESGLVMRRWINGAWVAQGSGAEPECKNGRANVWACTLADINGDGTTDVVSARATSMTADGTVTGDYETRVWLSTGSEYVLVSAAIRLPGAPILRDMDNDGKADILAAAKRSAINPFRQLSIYSLRLDASNAALVPASATINGSAISGDFNGDGLPDFLRTYTDLMISQSGAG